MIRCTNCGTLGCPHCVGTPSPGNQTCKVCKKSTKNCKGLTFAGHLETSQENCV